MEKGSSGKKYEFLDENTSRNSILCFKEGSRPVLGGAELEGFPVFPRIQKIGDADVGCGQTGRL